VIIGNHGECQEKMRRRNHKIKKILPGLTNLNSAQQNRCLEPILKPESIAAGNAFHRAL